MEKDSLEIIKKTEKEFEKKIEEKKESLENLKKERINFWLKKEKDFEIEHQAKIEGLAFQLKNDFNETEKQIFNLCEKKKQEIKKNAERNFENFSAEIFKRI